MSKFRSSFIVLSAPSGGGKTTIAKKLVRRHPEMTISVSATTRARRPLEIEGVDYYFITKEEFQQHIENDNFLEYEEVHGEYYGTLKSVVDDLVAKQKIVVFDIDVKGALSIKRIYPDAILIFIKAPTIEELERRLRKRRSEAQEAINKRLKRLPFEYAQADKFDYVILNEHLNDTIEEIESIVIES